MSIINLSSLNRSISDIQTYKREGIPLEKGVILTEEYLEKN